jgi:flagellar basal-body rod protein FlgF
MNEIMGIIRSAMQSDAEAVRVIGQNIANTEVTAYQRQIPLSDASFPEALAASAELTKAPRVAYDSQPGTLRSTGEPLHLALQGAGFFTVDSAEGLRVTRRGDLRVSADGFLTAATGDLLLGTSGPIHVGAAVPAIDSAGTVRVANQIVDQLRLVLVEHPEQMRYLGDGMFDAPANEIVDGSTATVRQGYLETSNVTPVGEMVQLMEAVRHFEAGQRLARGYDEMVGNAITELGKVR